MEKLISELLVPPEKVRKGDFVLNLSSGTKRKLQAEDEP
jgi:hypothetical protein